MSSLPSKKPVPTPEQRRAAQPERSVWVAANAGSGKTRVLVDRVVRLLLAGADPQAILCLTFTKAAAAEMSARLFQRLGGWVAMGNAALDEELRLLGETGVDAEMRAKARKLFARALETPSGLRIQTIHAFCERLLQLFPVESGLAPGFRVMTDDEKKELEERVFRDALTDAGEGSRAAWSFLDKGDVASLDSLIAAARAFLSDRAGLAQRLTDPQFLATLEPSLSAAMGGVDERSVEALDAEVVAIDRPRYLELARKLESYKTHKETPVALRAAASGSPTLQALTDIFITGSGTLRKGISPKDFATDHPEDKAWLDTEKDRIFDLLSKRALRQILDANVLAVSAFAEGQARIAQEKRKRGLYDFDDLIARTAQLLSSAESAHWVLNKLDAGISHILVDEAQDTSPAQWQIIKSLAEEFFSGAGRPRPEPRTIFAVGDAKQSIFSFQGADTRAFAEAQSFFRRKAGNSFDAVGLAVSYRSTPEVLRAVDMVFASGNAARLGYGENQAHERDHVAERKSEPGVFEIWPLIGPPKETEDDNWKAPVDRVSEGSPHMQAARLIASEVKSWIGKRQIAATGRPVAARDILILVQRRGGVLFQQLIAELRKRDVPVAGADRLKLQESLIIHDLLALGQALRLPQDDYALACVLKSPLVPKPLDENQLMHLAYGRQGQSLWQRLNAVADHTETAQYLKDLASLSRRLSPFDFFSRVTQRASRVIRERLGSEAEDAVAEFLNIAMEHELQHDVSLEAFLSHFARADTVVKREMEQASGEVRIMTVHGAKGLEAPIVILADAAHFQPEKTENSILHLPDDAGEMKGFPVFVPKTIVTPNVVTSWKEARNVSALAERYRLLYVAMTRARDELYVFGSVGKRADKDKNWYAVITSALESAATNLPMTERSSDHGTIRRYGAPVIPIAAKPDGRQAEVPLLAWATMPVSSVDQTTPNSAAFVYERSTARDEARRGIAIHRILELAGDAPEASRRDTLHRHAARLGLGSDDIRGVMDFLASPEARIFLGPTSSAEVEVRGISPSGKNVNSRVDRLVERPDGLWLLDYKSGRPQHLGPDHDYVRQLAKYVWLLRAAQPGTEVKAALLWTQTGALEWLSEALLSQAIERLDETPS